MPKAKSKKKQINIQFPLLGLNRKGAYRQQPPYSSVDLLNVRAVTGVDGRERGGSRPGIIVSHIDQLGGGTPVRLLTSMVLSLGDGFTNFSDTFSGSSLSSSWTQAAWATALPKILPTSVAFVDTTIGEAAAVLSALPIDTTKPYTVEVLLTPMVASWDGKYRLYFRLNDSTPNIAVEGVMFELTQTGTTGAFTGLLRSVIGSAPTDYASSGTIAVQPGWLSAVIDGDSVAVYWNGTLLDTKTVDAQTGKRVGFGMECTVDGGFALVNVFRVQYFSTGDVNQLRSMLVASAGGTLYKEHPYGRMEEVSSALTLQDKLTLTSAQDGQQLFIADYGNVVAKGDDGTVSGTAFDAASISDWTTIGILKDDMVVVLSNPTGTAIADTYKISTVAAGNLTLGAAAGSGTVSYRIERAPKIYDPLTNAISIYTATALKGQVPTGCPLICRYLDRIILAGAEIAPHVWYASRQGDPLDWDYVPEALDSQRAIAGPASEAGVPGDPITALAPHSDDYLIIGCRYSMWRMQGDPAYGGTLNNLSHSVGTIGPKAWCLIPSGELIFLSFDGVYSLAAGGTSYPIPISRDTLPREFLNINPDLVDASLEYDIQGQGIHIFLTYEPTNTRGHWWLDWNRKTFWKMSLSTAHEPTSTCNVQSTAIEDSCVVLGGRDGFLRRFSDFAEVDCGSAFSSYVLIGPIALAPDSQVGVIQSMNANMAVGSGTVTWALSPSLTFEGVVNAPNSDTGTWVEGLNATNHPGCRGQAFKMTLTGPGNRRWAVEQIDAIVSSAGVRRIP